MKSMFGFALFLLLCIGAVNAQTPSGKDVKAPVKANVVAWFTAGLAQELPQTWLIDTNKKVTFFRANTVDEATVKQLSDAPEKIQSTFPPKFAMLAEVAPHLVKIIEQHLADEKYVVLSVLPDLALIKTPKEPDNPCPECRLQTERLDKITNQAVSVIAVELGM